MMLQMITKKRVLIYSLLVLFCASGYVVIKHSHNAVPAVSPVGLVHCVGKNANFVCSMNYFEQLTRTFGTKTALEDLKKEYTTRTDVVNNCHQLAHVIGNTAVDTYGGDIAEAFQHGDSFCWSGYYHGVVERAVKESGKENFIAHANSLCAGVEGKERYSFDYYNCVHGLGHGIMAVTDDELFASLPLCDNLTGEWERKSCYGGVFMENIMVDNRVHVAKYLKKDDLMYPCNAVEHVYKEQCYLMQTSYALSQTNYDFTNTFRLCAQVEPAFRDTCAQSIGRDASGSSVSDVEKTMANCSRAENDRQEENCITGAVKDFISYFHGDGQAQRLCSAVPSRFQEHCNEVRTSYLKTL